MNKRSMENSAHPSQIIAFHLNPIKIRLAYNSPPLQYAIIQNLWDQNLGW